MLADLRGRHSPTGGWQEGRRRVRYRRSGARPTTSPASPPTIKVKGPAERFADRLELVQDEWGCPPAASGRRPGIAAVFAFTLVLFPVVFGWRTIFSRYPGKFGTMIYFRLGGLGTPCRRGGH